MDKLNHYPLLKKIILSLLGYWKCSQTECKRDRTLPSFKGLRAKPSNKSIIGEAPTEEFACAEGKDESTSNVAIGFRLSWLGDDMSGVDELLCTGVDVPMDKRSNRTSVPALGAWFMPKNAERNYNKYF